MNRPPSPYVSVGMDRTRGTRALLTVVAATAALTACSADTGVESGAESGAAGAALAEGTPYVVEDYSFPPLAVAPGQVVEVVDKDGEPHTLTATDGSFDTGSFEAGDPGRFTAPSKAGTYAFTCTIHPSMTGTLTVR